MREWDPSRIKISAKVRLLRHLPGHLGARYTRRYARYLAFRQFQDAVEASEGGLFIDLGANVGLFTRYMAAHAKRVIAFEPDPWTVATLKKNVADLTNVEVVEAAAGTADRMVELYRAAEFMNDPQAASESSSIVSGKLNIDNMAFISVQECDFIRFLQELDADIAVIKIDIEGAEVELLEKLLASPVLDRIGHVFVETHEKKIPALADRTAELRRVVATLRKPVFNMDWI